MKRYDGSYTEGFVLDGPGQHAVFTETSSIFTDAVAIMVKPSARGSDLVLAGDISANDYGIYGNARDASYEIRATGSVDAKIGVLLTGPDQSLANAGTIDAELNAVLVTGPNADVVNSGDITAAVAVAMQASEEGRLLNSKNGQISGTEAAVIFGGAYVDSETKLINLGSILSQGYAFQGSAAIDQVINRGVMGGDIQLNGGDDIFNGRRGQTTGQVYGGGGDDRYLVDDATTGLVEVTNDGHDTVISTVDYQLFDNFETLVLRGRENLHGRGNDEDNLIIGNSGDNRLYGYGGYNTLAGGRGDDWLLGGSQTDTFVFGTGDGHDAIKNFQDNVDYLDLGKWRGLEDFDVLLSHTTEENGNLVISFRGDQLIIESLMKTQLDIGDFVG